MAQMRSATSASSGEEREKTLPACTWAITARFTRGWA